MKCASCQKSLLLVLSHEASRWTQWRVDRHLRSCETCRRFREQYLVCMQTVRATSPEPNEQLMQTIVSFARRHAIRSKSEAHAPRSVPEYLLFRPAWIYGALSVVVLVVFVTIMSPMFRISPTDVAVHDTQRVGEVATAVSIPSVGFENNVDEQLDELALLLELTTEEAILSDNDIAITWSETEQLAQELLKWEDAQI